MSSVDVALKEADELHSQSKIHDNFKLLGELFNKGERAPELLWRLGRAHYDMAVETTDKALSQEHTEKGLELVTQAKEKLPDAFAAHKWYGILLSKKGDFIPTKEKIANAYTIRDSFLKAVEIKPDDATSLYCLGKWCWSVLQVSWLERQAASLLFGTPPSSTYEECEGYLKRSHEADKNQIYVGLLLGDLYYQQKKYGDAKIWYDAASKIPPLTENQKREVEDAKKKASKC